jgi:hypothetical protein
MAMVAEASRTTEIVDDRVAAILKPKADRRRRGAVAGLGFA